MARILDEMDDLTAPRVNGLPTSALEPVGEKQTVLIVEDDVSLRKLLRLYLGGDVAATDRADGDGLLTSLGEQPADLVVMDMNLPGASGLELIAAIRQTFSDHQRPMILLISGMLSQTSQDDLVKTGADDFLAKPFSRLEFVGRVRKLLGRKISPGTQVDTARE